MNELMNVKEAALKLTKYLRVNTLHLPLFGLLATLTACGGGGSGGDDTPNSAPIGTVSISGTVAERELLTASHNLTDADGMGTVTYRWKRDGVDLGATSSTYTLTYEDVDALITVTASYTDGAGNKESVDSDPTVAVGRKHDMLIVFGDYNLYSNTSTDSGASWNGATTFDVLGLTNGDVYHYDGDGASDGKGNIIVVWGGEAIPGYGSEIDIIFKTSNDDGATWSDLVAVNSLAETDSIDDEDPSIATNGEGRWIVVWSGPNADGGTGDDILYAISDDNGATWSAQTELASSVESYIDSVPMIANDGGDNWLVVWYSGDDLNDTIGADYDILYSYSSDNGETWSPRAALDSRAASDGSASDGWPSLAMDASGNAIVVWQSNNDLGGTVGTDNDIFVARSSDAGHTWTTSAVVNDNAATDGVGSNSDRRPQVAMDNAGNVVVLWQSDEDLDGTAGTDIDIFVASSSDLGANWSSVATLNSDAAMDGADRDEYPRITTDRDGNWLVVWRDTLAAFSSSVSTDNGKTWSPLVNVDEGVMSQDNYSSIPIVY
ncbi:sialidase family protein [Marinobacter sp. F4216]|uniref:sialidase family protein n=1 Tax=Marinobacter sp. F4216 TaxID=2874281 RepID=UPI001CBC4765|nr:sialidase family protein [Marinobacter sp. F4216]MBZ2169064.1 glycoside hydrolase [Marinobacter sp. F4216]